MANTFIKIQTVTVGSGGASSIDFTSIPQTYTDLKIVLSARANTSVIDVVSIAVNGGATAITSNKYLDGSGVPPAVPRSGVASSYQGLKQPSSYSANIFSNIEFYISNYIAATHKTITAHNVTENNAPEAYTGISTSLWPSTTAITSLSITNGGGGSFVQYTTATLYGIKSS